jgi:hypothetical protein
MNIRRYFVRALCGFAGAALVIGVPLHAEALGQNAKCVGKACGLQAKSHKGVTAIGTAYGPENPAEDGITLYAQKLTPAAALQLAPLFHGSPQKKSDNAFYFTPYNKATKTGASSAIPANVIFTL